MLAGLIWTGVAAALVAVFGRSKPMGGGRPGFIAEATPDLPGTVIGASFVRAGSQYFDVHTGQEISAEEAARRAVAEGMFFSR